MKPKCPESVVLKACLDILTVERIWHRRWNTGAVKVDKRFYRFGQSGDADILALPALIYAQKVQDSGVAFEYIKPLWIECKSDSGKQSEGQKEFQAEVEQQGHAYLLVRSVDTLRGWLREHGVIR